MMYCCTLYINLVLVSSIDSLEIPLKTSTVYRIQNMNGLKSLSGLRRIFLLRCLDI